MTDKVLEWNPELREAVLRDCTPEEQADIDARRAAGPTASEVNPEILMRLEIIDRKSIRALREGDQARIASLEAEAAALRMQLIKE